MGSEIRPDWQEPTDRLLESVEQMHEHGTAPSETTRDLAHLMIGSRIADSLELCAETLIELRVLLEGRQ
jgi:hypothetical protein